MKLPYTPELTAEYRGLFDTCEISTIKRPEVARQLDNMMVGIDRYREIGKVMGIPWWWIGAVHGLETSFKFSRHLHNGDPLTGRTVHVPPNRPIGHPPPFTWEESALDALLLQGLDHVAAWPLERALYEWERYNGFGYRGHGIFSPYLWSGSNHYVSGKYVQDGKWDAGAVSKQIGAATLLRHAVNQGVVSWAQPPSNP